jgi:hypothetical protein
MSGEVIVYKDEAELNPVERAIQRIEIVNQAYTKIMVRDQHFGVIPGTDKDTLLLPGAQKICVLFNLAPKIDKEETKDMGNGHREISMTVGLYGKKNGEFWGEGTGSCSTMESKYRYRSEAADMPDDYWQNKGKYPDLIVKKGKDGWYARRRVANPDIADVWNTVRKMCYKRALVSATITAAGIADIFNQDLDDMNPEDIGGRAAAPSNHTPSGDAHAPKAPKLDFNVLQSEVDAVTDTAKLDELSRRYYATFPNMSDKQKAVVDKIIDKRLSVLGASAVPAKDMFPEGE